MPSAANIVLADAQATPVNHTFKPIGLDKDGTFWYEDQSVGGTNPPAIGYWRVGIQVKNPPYAGPGENSANRKRRIIFKLLEPVLETLSNSTVSGIVPAPTVSYIPWSDCEFPIPERATYLDRANLLKMMGLLLQTAVAAAVVVDGESIY